MVGQGKYSLHHSCAWTGGKWLAQDVSKAEVVEAIAKIPSDLKNVVLDDSYTLITPDGNEYVDSEIRGWLSANWGKKSPPKL
ncbi:hypothetical protein M3899_003265 [Vibrio parahaemolyticus]|nr:hypothetical protein [Vibrio parahaemolyticus]